MTEESGRDASYGLASRPRQTKRCVRLLLHSLFICEPALWEYIYVNSNILLYPIPIRWWPETSARPFIIGWPAPMAHSYRLRLVAWRYQVRIPVGSDIVITGVHIQWYKLFKGLECTVLPMVLCTIKNPWSYSGFLLSRYRHDCAESEVRQYSLTSVSGEYCSGHTPDDELPLSRFGFEAEFCVKGAAWCSLAVWKSLTVSLGITAVDASQKVMVNISASSRW